MKINLGNELNDLRNPAPSIKEMASKTGLPLVRLANLIPDLVNDILRTWHTRGNSPELDSRIEDAFQKINGYKYKNRGMNVVPLFIKGPPGQGKTTAFRVALKIIAEAMGVKLYINPNISDQPSKYDIVSVEATLAGLLSPTSLVGIPQNQDGTTVYLPPARMKRLGESNFSLLVLDDLENAVPGVKNAAMPAILDKILIDFKLGDCCYVGATGNLGAVDGTNVSLGSDALFNRMETHLAYDTIGDWIDRARSNPAYQDEIGLCFLDEFFIQNPSVFYPTRDSKVRGPTATSRSYDGLLSTLRNEFGDHWDRTEAGLNPPDIITKLKSTMHGQVGDYAATHLETFYADVLSVAYPAAIETMSKTKLSDDYRKQLFQIIAESKTPKSEGIARSYLRQVEAIATTKIFGIMNQPPAENEISLKQRSLAIGAIIDRFTDALFTVGLVKGNKTNLISLTCLNMARNLIQRSEARDASERHYNFGHINKHGLPVLNEALTKVLVSYSTSKDSPHNEAMLKVGEKNGEPLTAVETAIIDPLTQTSEIVSLQQEEKEARLAMQK